jgi:hypothetical protein
MASRVFALLLVLVSGIACSTLQASAAKDPMKCERDPKCVKHKMKGTDCTTQCADDPACMDRCAQTQSDGLGR